MRKLLLILLGLPVIGVAQDIKNVEVSTNDDLAEISYDLIDVKNNFYNIKLKVSEGNTVIVQRKKSNTFIYGDIGKGIIAGKHKKIYWNVLEDDVELVGDNLIFEVSADVIKQRSTANFLLPGRYNYFVSNNKKYLSKSLLFYSALAAGIYFGSVSSTNHQKYNDATNFNEMNDYYNKANSSLQLSYLCYTVTGTVMIDNIYRLFKKNKVR